MLRQHAAPGRRRRGVDAMAVRQPLDAIAAAPRARAGLVLVCCLIRCCPMGSRWSPSGRAARWGHDRQRSRRARWATTSRAFAGRRRWTRLVGAHIDSATPRLDSDSQAAVDVFYCDAVSVNAVLAELRSPCSKNEKKTAQNDLGHSLSQEHSARATRDAAASAEATIHLF